MHSLGQLNIMAAQRIAWIGLGNIGRVRLNYLAYSKQSIYTHSPHTTSHFIYAY